MIINTLEELGSINVANIVKMWVVGIVIAVSFITYGIYCTITEKALLPGLRLSWSFIKDKPAISLGVAYTAIGFLIHFHYFWAVQNNFLAKLSDTGKILALITFSISIIYMIYLLLFG